MTPANLIDLANSSYRELVEKGEWNGNKKGEALLFFSDKGGGGEVAVIIITITVPMVMVEIFLGHVPNLLMEMKKCPSMGSPGFGVQSVKGGI